MLEKKTNRHDLPAPAFPIAIVSVGCKFPGGANNPAQFWENLRNGVDSITEVPKDRWDIDAWYDPDFSVPGKMILREGGFVDDIAEFDPQFFGISPREAATMDPQQRLLLEVSQQAFENAGIPPSSLAGSATGVYVGISSHDYGDIISGISETRLVSPYSNTGSALSIAANRISYVFDLRGPSLAIDTACSSSLVALHHACLAMYNGECEQALVGGVSAILRSSLTLGFSRGGFLSPSGRCRAFDADADGYVRSEGAGIVLIKPLSAAQADGDPILCVLRGTAVQQDGRTEGLPLPSPTAQKSMLQKIYQRSGIDPSLVDYVEAHGTGTSVGDPIEANAIGTVLGDQRNAEESCLIGSVKTNIGHLEAGSGAAGLIKLALSLHHGEIPPSLHFNKPNPNIPFSDLKLCVVTELTAWPQRNELRTGAINSFGFGGTSAHAILQSWSPPDTEDQRSKIEKQPTIVSLSARSQASLEQLMASYETLIQKDNVSLQDIAWSSIKTRDNYLRRVAIVASDIEEFSMRLKKAMAKKEDVGVRVGRASSSKASSPVAFVFSGQGPQWWAMGRQLLEEDPAFTATIQECDKLLSKHADWSLMDELTATEEDSRINDTYIAQPALFALQVALARRWIAFGIKPDVVVGHSIGEVAAAVIAGVFSLADGIRIIFHRSRVQHLAAGKGKMIAVALNEEEAKEVISPFEHRVSIAAINSPGLITLSGDSEPLEQIAAQLEKDGIFHRFLQVPVPFHSYHMDPLKEDLINSLNGLKPGQALIPVYSTVLGRRIESSELDKNYWFRNVREPVLFAPAMREIIKQNITTFVELAPHPVLASSIESLLSEQNKQGNIVSSLRREEDESLHLLSALAELHVSGYAIEPPQAGCAIALPNYPWQKENYWLETTLGRKNRIGSNQHPFIKKHIRSAISEDDHIWEVELDKQREMYLDDHRVQGTVVFPAAGYFDVLVACITEVFEQGSMIEFEKVRILRALFLADDQESPEVRVELSDDVGRCDILSRRAGSDDNWTQHMSTFVKRYGTPELPTPLDIDAVRDRCKHKFDVKDCYARFHASGLELGPRFQCIVEAHGNVRPEGCSEVIARIEIPDAIKASSTRHALHPAVLDSLFQPLLIAVNATASPEEVGLYLPASMGRVVITPNERTDVLFSYAHIKHVSASDFTGELYLLNDKGELIAFIESFVAQHIRGTRKESRGGIYTNMLDAEWQLIEDEKDDQDEVTADNKVALVVGSDKKGTNLVNDLILQLNSRGYSVVQTTADNSVAGFSDSIGEVCTKGDFSLVMHLGALAISDDDNLQQAHKSTTGSLMNLHAAISTLAMDNSPQWTIVTSGAQLTYSKEVTETVNIMQAPVWGFGRVLMNEASEWNIKLIDLSDSPTTIELDSLITQCLHGDHKEMVLRGDERYQFRLKPTTEESAKLASLHPASWENDAYTLEIGEPGVLDSIILREVDREKPKQNEVEIRVCATGLNFRDLMMASGLMTPEMWQSGFYGPHMGMEISGVITAVGDCVTDFVVGDEVMAPCTKGFSRYIYTSAQLTSLRPDNISREEAAGLGVAFTTAYHALVKVVSLQKGERVLIHAATGGVGMAAVQIAKCIGAEIFATAGNDHKRQTLRDLGVKHVMDSRSLIFAEQIMDITHGKGVDVVLNSLSGKAISRSMSCLSRYGRFVEIGKTDIYANSRIGLLQLAKNISLFIFDLDQYLADKPQSANASFREALSLRKKLSLDLVPYKTFHISKLSEALRFMARSAHIGKVIISSDDSLPIPIAPQGSLAALLKSDSTYVITGGTSGFGLEIARWLVDNGVNHLALISRSGAKQQDVQDFIQNSSAEIVAFSADVGDEQELSQTLNEIRKKMPPIKGVIHGAMVLEDGVIAQMTDEQFMRVMQPKAGGALNLHKLTQDKDDLDLFVMLSSVSSVFGSPGQANYSAANATLEALAAHRRQKGLVGTAINFGVIGEVGVAARSDGLIGRLESMGWNALSIEEATRKLGQVMVDRPTQRIVANFDWEKVENNMLADATRERFSFLLAKRDNAEGDAGLRNELLALDRTDQNRRILSLITEELARILGMESDSLPTDEPITNLGIDSLMATQLSNWLNSKLGIMLPLMKLLQGPSLEELSVMLGDSLNSKGDNSSTDDTSPLLRFSTGADTDIRIFCLPPLGEQADMFAPWANLLPNSIEACGLRVPSQMAPEQTPEQQLDILLDSFCEAIVELDDRPFALYGHSFGAFLAFQLSQRMREKYEIEPVHLFIGGWRAPQINEVEVIESQAPRLDNESEEDWFKRWTRDFIGMHEDSIQNPEVIKMVQQSVFDGEALSCPITAFRGESDKLYANEHIRPWKDVTTGRFRMIEVEGPHLFLEIDESQKKVLSIVADECSTAIS